MYNPYFRGEKDLKEDPKLKTLQYCSEMKNTSNLMSYTNKTIYRVGSIDGYLKIQVRNIEGSMQGDPCIEYY